MQSSQGKLILASASPRRKFLLQKASLNFDIKVSNVDEAKVGEPIDLAQNNAYLKALDIAKQNPYSLVLGADTIVVQNNKVFGKPIDLTDAKDMLSQLQGKKHYVCTAIAIVKCGTDKEVIKEIITHKNTDVYFKTLSDKQIDEYIAKVEVLDKAGSYAIQEHAELIIDKIDGDEDNVMGLPVELVIESLKDF